MKSVTHSMIILLAMMLMTSISFGDVHVTPRDGTRVQNGYVDPRHEADTVSLIQNGEFRLSDTIKPPIAQGETCGYEFAEFTKKKFTWKHVDITVEPITGLMPITPIDTEEEIRIAFPVLVGVPVYPLYAEGNLTPPSTEGESGYGNAECWTVKSPHEIDVKIIAVPKYLFANATAAVPVKFQVLGAGENVTIQKVNIAFYYSYDPAYFIVGPNDWEEIFKTDCNFAKAYRKDEGWDVVVDRVEIMDGTAAIGNGTTDTYVAWIPVNENTFRQQGIGITSLRTSFVVEVTLADGKTGESQINDPAARPKVFGSTRVEVVELRTTNSEICPTDPNTIQDKCDRSPDINIVHVDSSRRIKYADEWPHVRDKSIEYRNGGCPYCHKHPNPAWPDPINWLSYSVCTAQIPSHNFGLEGEKQARIWLTACSSKEYSNSDEWHKMQLQMYDLTIGCYFGVSYGHVDVQVLGAGAKGMDLREDNLTQVVPVNGFVGARPEISVETTHQPADVIDWTKVGGSIAEVAVAGAGLINPGFGFACAIVKEAATLMAEHTRVIPPEGPSASGEGYVVGTWQCVKGGSGLAIGPVEGFAPVHHNGAGGKLKTITGVKNLSHLGLNLEVGDTYIGAIKLGAVVNMHTVSNDDLYERDSDCIEVIVRYIIDGNFTDNQILVHTETNN